MATKYVDIRVDITDTPEFLQLCGMLDLSEESGLLAVFKVAAWFQSSGHYGTMEISERAIDRKAAQPGLAEAMRRVGWLRLDGSVFSVQGFCTASVARKSLGRTIRSQVLSAGKCAACGSSTNLEVDHIVPIARGGSCRISNLQALCSACNRSKGKKLPSEWSPAHG